MRVWGMRLGCPTSRSITYVCGNGAAISLTHLSHSSLFQIADLDSVDGATVVMAAGPLRGHLFANRDQGAGGEESAIFRARVPFAGGRSYEGVAWPTPKARSVDEKVIGEPPAAGSAPTPVVRQPQALPAVGSCQPCPHRHGRVHPKADKRTRSLDRRLLGVQDPLVTGKVVGIEPNHDADYDLICIDRRRAGRSDGGIVHAGRLPPAIVTDAGTRRAARLVPRRVPTVAPQSSARSLPFVSGFTG